MSTESVAAKMGASPEMAKAIEDTCIEFGISSTLAKAHFIAQIAHESGNFKYTKEIWGPTPAQKRYEGRADLGNVNPGDGSKFRGRGLIQITGRANYTAYSRFVYGDNRCVSFPEMLERQPDAAMCAGWFWVERGCQRFAEEDDVVGLTKRINGGLNGLDDRIAKTEKAKRLFSEFVK
jgi:putative chitinase